ncbi:MAG: Rrf2 family transcriptional regulator [Eubacterium sp.]|nr:Rrf2 family transcriptional regulator [Candidatus Colimonas fimequi]
MKISTKGRYAVRVMLDLAINNTGEYIPLKDVAERQGITLKYLEQIIILLKKAGYLNSSRGNGGGYKLAKQPADYTIGDILRTTEGSLAPVSCLDGSENHCERRATCPTLELWEGLRDVMNNYVDSITLDDLLQKQVSLIGSDYII